MHKRVVGADKRRWYLTWHACAAEHVRKEQLCRRVAAKCRHSALAQAFECWISSRVVCAAAALTLNRAVDRFAVSCVRWCVALWRWFSRSLCRVEKVVRRLQQSRVVSALCWWKEYWRVARGRRVMVLQCVIVL